MDHVLWCIGHELVMPNITRAEGCYVYDRKGRTYVDFESGVWCTPLGHGHPRVKAALTAQLDKVAHTGYCYADAVVDEAAAELLEITGLTHGKCLFLCSGTEAVDFGIRVLRYLTGKPRLLTLADSFLGAYGSAERTRADEWHLLDWSACRTCPRSGACDAECELLAAVPFAQIGGFVFEPGSASGLVRFPPQAFIRNIIRAIRRHEGWIQVNEITTGLGRTGRWFGFQHYELQPDVVSMGKGLGNGYPVSAVALSSGITTQLERRGFTYAQSHQNDPLGCAAAKAVVVTLKQENIIEQGRSAGEYLLGRMLRWQESYGVIKEVRGRGLMIAVEFAESLDGAVMVDLFRQCLKGGFIIARRPGLNVFRIDPPLIVSRPQMDRFLDHFESFLTAMS
jgi:acetylornithine aminotransferase